MKAARVADIGLHLEPDHVFLRARPTARHNLGAKMPCLLQIDLVGVHLHVGYRQAHVRGVHQVLHLPALTGPVVEHSRLHQQLLERHRPTLGAHRVHVVAPPGAANRALRQALLALEIEHVADELVRFSGQHLPLPYLGVDAGVLGQESLVAPASLTDDALIELFQRFEARVVSRVYPVVDGHDFFVVEKLDDSMKCLVHTGLVLPLSHVDLQDREVAIALLLEL